MLREYIVDIVAAAKQRRFFVSLLTNGTLIDENIVCQLKRLGIERVDLSFYGATASMNDAITGVEGSFDAFCRGLTLLKEAELKVSVKATVTRSNQASLENMKRFAASFDVPFRCDPKILPRMNGDVSTLDDRLDPSEYTDALWSEVWGTGEQTIEWIKSFDNIEKSEKNTEICKAGFLSCAIRSTGIVSPCVVLPIDTGSIRDNCFEDIWNSDSMNDYRKLSSRLFRECRTCSLSSVCFRCPAYSCLEEGDIMKIPEYSCRSAVYSHAYLNSRELSNGRSQG